MTLPENHFLAEYDLTTPANHRHAAPNGRSSATEAAAEPGPAPRRDLAAPATALVFLAAVWLVVAAVPVDYWGTGRFDVFWNDVVVGLALAAVAMLRLARPAVPSLSGITFALGGWLVLAPFVLGYGGGTRDVPALWNHVGVGVAVLVLTWLGAPRPVPVRR
jgi:hypothetical protein